MCGLFIRRARKGLYATNKKRIIRSTLIPIMFKSCSNNKGMKGGIRPIYADIKELAEKETIKRWLNSMAPGPTAKISIYALARYLRWRRAKGLESDPDKLIQECLDGNNRTLVRHLQEALEYVSQYPGKRGTVEKQYELIRSFYAHNFVSLPMQRLSIKAGTNGITKEVTATDYLEYVKAVLEMGKLGVRDRAIILTMLQSGMDASTLAESFNFYAYPQIAEQLGPDPAKWDLSRCPVRIVLVRPKREYRYYTFLDIDAVEAIRDYFLRKRGIPKVLPALPGEMPRSEPIFLNKHGEPITAFYVSIMFRRAGKKAGVNKADQAFKPGPYKGASLRYPFHSHEVRDTFITIAKRAGADLTAANFFVGHSIDKYGYDKSPWDDPEYYRNEYIKIARPWLNPLTGQALKAREEALKEAYSAVEQRIRSLEERLSKLLGAPSPS